MTAAEFNEKYRKYAEPRFEDQLLQIDIPKVTEYLDSLFEGVLIDEPGFNFAQIKLKFGTAIFYSNLPHAWAKLIEGEINALVDEK